MVSRAREIASGFGRRNVLINGKFDIWQRGTSFVIPAPGVTVASSYQTDRWRHHRKGDAALNISRSTDVPTFAQAGIAFNFSIKLSVTTPDITITSTDDTTIDQALEGFDFISIWQQPLVFSFWVKASIPGIRCCYFRNHTAILNPDRSVVMEYTINLANTWEYKQINVPPPPFFNGIDNAPVPAPGTWVTDNRRAFDAGFTLASGSAFQTTPGTWQTGNFITTANQVNGVAAVGDFLITGVQLEVGTVATEFEYRTFGEELVLCQRYFEKSYRYQDAPGTVTVDGALQDEEFAIGNTAHLTSPCTYKVTKRDNPMVVALSPDTGVVGKAFVFASDTVAINMDRTGIFQDGGVTNVGVFTFNTLINSGTSTPGRFRVHFTAEAEL